MLENAYIDRMNYFNDARTQGRAEVPVLYTHDGPVELPTKWVVCPVCDGAGSHVNPSIDAGGLSDEHCDDPEFMDDYMSGVYDVPCNCCGGRTTILDVDWSRMTEGQARMYHRQLDDEAADRAMHRAELIMGA